MSADRPSPSPALQRRRFRGRLIRSSALVAAALLARAPAMAQTLPTAADVASTVPNGAGNAPIITNPTATSLQVDLRANSTIINWNQFSVPEGNSANFTDATGGAVTGIAVLNRVIGATSSQILGNLTSDANVSVFLINPNGVLFGANSSVSVGALVASTRSLTDADFNNGSGYTFSGVGSSGVVVQAGAQLEAIGSTLTTQGIVLIGASVASAGTLDAPGDIALIAADTVDVTLVPGSPLSMTIQAGTALSTPMTVSGTINGRNVLFAAATRGTVTDALLDVRAAVTATTASATDRGIILAAGPSGAANDRVSFVVDATTDGALTTQVGGTLTATGGGNGRVAILSRGAIQREASSAAAVIDATGAVNLFASSGSIEAGALSSDAGGVTAVAGSGSLTLGAVNAGGGALTLTGNGGSITAGNLTAGGAVAVNAGTGIDLGTIGGSSVALTALSGTIDADAITASTGGVTVAGDDDVAIGNVTGGAGAIQLSSLTGALSAGTITSVSGGVTASASDSLGLGGVDAGAGAITLTSANAGITAGNLTSGADITVSASAGAVQLGAVSAQDAVQAGGTSLQATSLVSTAAGVQASASAGDVTVGSVEADGLANISATGALQLGSVTGGTLSLAGTSLGGIAPGARTALTSGADINLILSGGLLLGAVQATGDLLLSGSTVDATSIASSGGAVSVTATAGDLAVGSVTDGNSVSLTANSGTLSGGAITSDTTIGLSAESIDLGALTGTVLTLNSTVGDARIDGGAISGGTLTVAGNLIFDALLSGTDAITANVTGDLTGSGISTTGSAGITVGGNINAGQLTGGSGLVVSADAVTLASAGNSSGLAQLTATSGVLTLGGGSFADLDLAGAGIVLNGLVTATGSASIVSTGSIQAAAIDAGGTLDLSAATSLTAGNLTGDVAILLAGTTIDTGVLTGGTLTLAASAGDARIGGGTVASGTLDATGNLIFDGLLTGTGNLIATAGNDLLGVGITTAGTLEVDAGQAVDAVQLAGVAGLDVAADAITLGSAGASSGLIALTASSGGIDVGALTAGSDATLSASASATVRGDVSVTGTYAVTGTTVTLGGTPGALQQADGAVTITSTSGGIFGLGDLTLRSNADGVGSEALSLSSATTLNFAATTLLAGGTARQSNLSLGWLNNGSALVLGGISALGINAGSLSNFGAVTFGGAVSLTNSLAVQSTFSGINVAGIEVLGTGSSLSLASGLSQSINSTGALAADGQLTLSASGGINALGLSGTDVQATASNGNLVVTDVLASGLVRLNASTGSITAASLTAGTSSLALLRDAVVSARSVDLGALSIGTDLTVTATTGQLTVGGGSVGNLLTLTKLGLAGDLLINGTLVAGASVGSTGTINVDSATDVRIGALRTLTGSVSVDATGTIDGLSPGAGATVESASPSGSLSVIAGGALTLAGFDAGANITLSSGGAITLDGALSITGNLNATGSTVDLGTGTKQAGGSVQIVTTSGSITGDPSGSILSNSDGLGGGDLILRSAGDILLVGYGLSAGPARQSAVRIAAAPTGLIALGNVDARALVSWDAPLTQTSVEHGGTLAFGNVSVVDDLLVGNFGIEATALEIASAQSFGDIFLNAGSVTGAGGGRADLNAGGLLVVNTGQAAGGTRQVLLGDISGNALVYVTGQQVDVTSATSGSGYVFLEAAAYAADRDVTLTAGAVAAATDAYLIAGSGTGTGLSADDGRIQLGSVSSAGGDVLIDAAGGAITGIGVTPAVISALAGRATIEALGPIALGTLTVRDGATIASTGAEGAVSIGTISASSGGVSITAANSALAGAAGIDLGTVQVADALDVSTTGTRGDITIADALVGSGNVNLTSVGGLRLGSVEATNGAITVAGSEITGLAGGAGPLSGGFGRADLIANGAIDLGATGIIQLGTVDAGGALILAGGATDAVSISAGSLQIDAAGALAIGAATANAGTATLVSSGAVDIGTLSATAGVSVTTTGDLFFGTIESSTAAVSLVAGGAARGTLLRAFTTASVDADAIDITTIDASGLITLRSAGSLDLGSVSNDSGISLAAGGDINFVLLESLNAGIALDAGGALTGGSLIAAGDVAATGGTVDIGSVNAASLTARSTGPMAIDAVTVTGNARFDSDAAVALGTVEAGGTLAIAGLDDIGFVSLIGDQVTIDSGAALAGGAIEAAGEAQLRAMSIDVDNVRAAAFRSQSTGVTTLDDLAVNGSAAVTSGGATSLGDVTAAALTVTAGGVLGYGSISGGAATLNASQALSGGDVTLTGAGTFVSGGAINVGNVTAGTTLAIEAGDSLVAGSLAAGGAATLRAQGALTTGGITAGSLIVDAGGALALGDVTAGGAVELSSDAAAVLASIDAGAALALNVAGDVEFLSLDGASVSVNSGAAVAGTTIISSGAVEVTSAGATTIGSLSSGAVTIASGALNVGTLSATGAVAIDTAGDADLGQLTAGAGLALAAEAITIDQATVTGDAELDGTGAITLGDFAATGGLRISSGGALAFETLASGSTSNIIATAEVDGGAINAGGSVSIESQQSIELDDVAATGTLTLRVAGAALGPLSSALVSPSAAPAGEIVLGAARTTGAATLAAPGRITITGPLDIGGDLTVTGASIGLGGGTPVTQRATGSMTLTAGTGAITGAAGLVLDAGRALSLTARGSGGNIDLASDARIIAATDLTLDTLGTLAVGGLTGGSGLVTLGASDLALDGTLSANEVRLINRGNGLFLVGETPEGNAGEFDGAPAGFRLSNAELGRITAATLTVDAGTGGFMFGDSIAAAGTGSQRLAWRTTGRIDVLGRFVAEGSSASREVIFGGDGAGGLAELIRIAARSDGGGRIIAEGAILTLEAARIGAGYDRDLLTQVGLTPGSNRNPTPREIAATLVSRSSSSLYVSTLAGEPFYQDPALIRAGALNVRYEQFALFQNTGLPGTTSGVELSGIAGMATLNLLARETPGGNAFAFFGSINGVSGKETSLLGSEGINLDLPVDRGSSRANGCLIGSAGGGCLVASLAQPQLLLVENNTEIFGSSNLLTVPFDPLVGSSNEALFADIAGFDIPVDPPACDPADASCKLEPQP